MVCHTSALSCMATASSKQAHHHTSSTTPPSGAHGESHLKAGQEICQCFNFGRCNKRATRAGSQAVVKSTQPRPGHVLHHAVA